MKVEIVGSYGGESPDCRLTCLLFEDTVALDAGSLSQALSIERQRQVQAIVLTHSHMDHTSALPFFIENVFGKLRDAVDIYASAATIYAIRKNLFNNDVWPDFTRLPNHLLPVMRFHELVAEVPVEINGLRFTPIPVDHPVPTFGYLVEDGQSAVLWSSDTGPTQRLWEVANAAEKLKGVWVDVSFENALQPIADVSGHLTPRTLAEQVGRLERDVPVLLHHLKPPSIAKIHEEVAALGNPAIGFLEQGRVYQL
jgi:ribonuclease BN (tRNA processing enzyme)